MGVAANLVDLPEPERVVIRYFESDAEATEAMKKGTLDAGPEVSYEVFQAIRDENPNVIAWSPAAPISWPGHCPRQLDFNTVKAPWNDPALRKALSHFVDRAKIVNEAYRGQTRPSRTVFPELGGLVPVIGAIAAAGHANSPSADNAAGDQAIAALGDTKGTDGLYEKEEVDLTLAIHVSDQSAKRPRS